MNSKYKITAIAVLAFWLVIGLNACSDDNSTGPGQEEECTTSLPSEFAPAQVDVQYFQNQEVPNDEDHSNYQMVSQTAITGASILSSGAYFGLATSLIQYGHLSDVEPEFSDGSCVWDFSQIPGYQGLGVTVTSTTTGSGVNWDVHVDGDLGEGEELDNFRLVSGFTSTDGLNGEWNYYDPETNTAILNYTWDIESDDNYELNLDVSDEETVATINYVKDGVENHMSFDDGEESTNLYWNVDDDSGWIETNEGRLCYTDFENSACS